MLAAALLLAALTGCASAPEREQLLTRIGELQLQLLEMEQRMATREETATQVATVRAPLQTLIDAQTAQQARLDAINARLDQLERLFTAADDRSTQTAQDVAGLGESLQALRLAVEREQMRADRIADASARSSDPALDPQALYDAAYAHVRDERFDLAVLRFNEYLSLYPDGERAANAAYWLGEARYRQRRFNAAIEQFDRVLREHQNSDKVASAQLKKGFSLLELGRRAEGILQLRAVTRDHPETDEAQLARQRLQAINADGEDSSTR
ncbi:MAG: tol-pal system protein YbgF [Acidobacteriota bacterium]